MVRVSRALVFLSSIIAASYFNIASASIWIYGGGNFTYEYGNVEQFLSAGGYQNLSDTGRVIYDTPRVSSINGEEILISGFEWMTYTVNSTALAEIRYEVSQFKPIASPSQYCTSLKDFYGGSFKVRWEETENILDYAYRYFTLTNEGMFYPRTDYRWIVGTCWGSYETNPNMNEFIAAAPYQVTKCPNGFGLNTDLTSCNFYTDYGRKRLPHTFVYNLIIANEEPTCKLEPLRDLETISPSDPRTLILETTLGSSGYSFLTNGTQWAEKCFQSKAASNNLIYKLSSTFRTEAYQSHLKEVWDKNKLIEKSTESDKRACSGEIEKIKSEMDKHSLVYPPAMQSEHSDGEAFDISKKSVRSILNHINITPKYAIMAEYIAYGENCHLGWGGEFYPEPDVVHFFNNRQ
jgi:hypothetical protein